MISTAIFLFLLGLCLGSFLNAWVYRLHAGMDFVRGRSQCDHCGHALQAIDLVPLISWLSLRGRCRYCHKTLSWQHPLVELATGLTFSLSYWFWPGGLLAPGEMLLFVTWLISSVGLLALLVYDTRWMLLPSKILYPTLTVAILGRAIYSLEYAPAIGHALLSWLLGVAAASGLFFLIFWFSSGRLIGFGDVRLGLVTGTLLADPEKAFLMILLASIGGTLFVLPGLLSGKKKVNSRIPYGPFLIAASAIALIFGSGIIDWYRQLFIP